MIESYVNKLIDNLPYTFTSKNATPLELDVVLSGGGFNGSYLIGALYFLKEMENRNYIKIHRISGCSIGSIAGLLYIENDLKRISTLYKYITKQFKKKHNLSEIKNIRTLLGEKIIMDYAKANDKLYICYNNIETGVKIVKSRFDSADDLCNTIIKSCFIPLLIDENICYKSKYIDGINPYTFKLNSGSELECKDGKERKVLFLDLFTFNKASCLINIKNEKNAFHRVLTGLLEIHNFFIKGTNTDMCSYVNDWSIIQKSVYSCKLIIERMIVYFVSCIVYINKWIGNQCSKNKISVKCHDFFVYKVTVEVVRTFFAVYLDTYCF
jgi:hypothetical protein